MRHTSSGMTSISISLVLAVAFTGAIHAQEVARHASRASATAESATITSYNNISSPNVVEEFIGAPIEAANGGYYGSASGIGENVSPSAIYEVVDDTLTVPYTFSAGLVSNGEVDPRQLVQGADGNFYGTTLSGGAASLGTIFQLTPGGVLTTLYSFTGGADGGGPKGALVQGTDGNFYGTTSGQGYLYTAHGTIFKITPSGQFTTLYTFTGGADGDNNLTGLLQGIDGNFYGTTARGGASGFGTLFQWVPGSSTVNVLYAFTGAYGSDVPVTGLVQGNDGTLYGATGTNPFKSPCPNGCGNVGSVYSFHLTAASTGTFRTLNTSLVDPVGLTLGSDGNLYGLTEGSFDELFLGASAFQMTQSGELTTIFNFSCSINAQGGAVCPTDGIPLTGLTQGSDGNLYSVTQGEVFDLALSPALPAPIQLTVPATVTVNTATEVQFQSLVSFSATMQQCNAFATNQSTGLETALGAVTGTVVNGVYSGAFAWTPTSAAAYLLAVTCGGAETGLATVTATTSAGPTATALTVTPNLAPVISGQEFQATVNVTANNAAVAGGNVSLTCEGVSLGTLPLTNGSAIFSAATAGLPANSYSCVASYSGVAGKYLASSNPFTVNVVNQTSNISLVPATATIKQGSNVTLTATVTGQIAPPASGVVAFRLANGYVLGAAYVNGSGVASITIDADAPVGTYTVTATYYGTPGTGGSTATGTYTLQ